MNMFKEVADIKTSDQLHLPVPEAKFETVVVQPSEYQKDMVASLSERAADVHAGIVDPSVDNMLKITSDGRKLGLDQRLMNTLLPDDPDSKLNACVGNILRIWQDGQADKLCDTNHVLSSDYSEVIVVGAGADAVDYKLISICHRGDIVVSQDYGVAAMALGKGAYAIHQSGKWYTNENIDQMLMERHLNKKARRASGKNHLKGPRKRTAEDDEHFRASFEKMIRMAMDKEN